MGSHPLRLQNFPHNNKKQRFGQTFTFSNNSTMFASLDLKNEEMNYLDHWTHLHLIPNMATVHKEISFISELLHDHHAGGCGINLFLPLPGV